MGSETKYKLISLTPATVPGNTPAVVLLNNETGEEEVLYANGVADFPYAHQILMIVANFCHNSNDTDFEHEFGYILNSVRKVDECVWEIIINQDINVHIKTDSDATQVSIIENIALHGLDYVINNITDIPLNAFSVIEDDSRLSENSTTIKLFNHYLLEVYENANQAIKPVQLSYALINATALVLMVEGCYDNPFYFSGVDNIEIVPNNLFIPTCKLYKIDSENCKAPIEEVKNVASFINFAYKINATDNVSLSAKSS